MLWIPNNMKRKIDVFEYAGQILKVLKPSGCLLTTAVDGKVNTMTIGWGTLGVDFSRPVFIAYVRDSRYTHEILSSSDEFTVNIPVGQVDKKILGFCGTRSGRDVDKIAELGLHTVEPEVVSVPGIRELPLTLECKIFYRQGQDPAHLPGDIVAQYYPHGGYHTVYYGEIVSAYIIEE